MIYLFCNQGYGQSFLDAAKKYSHKNKIPITVVLSSKVSNLLQTQFSNSILSLKSNTKKYIKKLKLANSYQMNIILTSNINFKDFYNMILPEDHGIITGFNQIFKQKTINKFKSLVNFHPSILPLYRGPNPSYWCLKNKELRSGYTLHEVTSKIDAGKILYQEYLNILDIDNSLTLDKAIANKAVPCFLNYLEYLQTNKNWISTILDAKKIYTSFVDYASFPDS